MYDNVKRHPSYGIIQINRVVSNRGIRLYGSSVRQNNTIVLRIKPSEYCVEGDTEYFFEKGIPFIEVEMTSAQFADAITSMNTTGVPCTINYLNGERIPHEEVETKRAIHENHFKNVMKTMSERIKRLRNNSEELLKNKKGALNKADKESLYNDIYKLVQDIESNIPFYMEQFNESMDKVVTEAKSEIEAFITMKTQALGVEKLQEQFSTEAIEDKTEKE
jgi:hypothetical protein